MSKIVIWFWKKKLTWTQFRTLKIKNQSSKELTNFILKSINHSHQAYILTIYVKSPDKWKLRMSDVFIPSTQFITRTEKQQAPRLDIYWWNQFAAAVLSQTAGSLHLEKMLGINAISEFY